MLFKGIKLMGLAKANLFFDMYDYIALGLKTYITRTKVLV